MTMFCLILVNVEASAETNSDQALSSIETETEQNEIPEICYQVNKEDFYYYSENLNAFFNDIRFIPIVTDDRIRAYKIDHIKKNSIISHYAPEVGVEITHTNNKPVKEIKNLITAISLINKGKSLELSIINNVGQIVNYKYLFNPESSCSDT